MKEIDQLLSAARDIHPALSGLLSVFLDGGQVVELQQALVPVSLLNFRDLVIVENPPHSLLLELNQKTSAQIFCVSEKSVDESLVDYQVAPGKFQEIRKAVPEWFDKIKPHLKDFRYRQDLKPAVFLDRDGVVLKFVDYISKPQDVVLKQGIVEFLKRAELAGFYRIIVTNQSGLGRELFDMNSYERVHRKMLQLIQAAGTDVDATYCAPYFDKSQKAFALMRRSFRKPRPGMLIQAAADWGVDLKRSVFIGDSASDMVAAHLAAISRAYFIQSPRGPEELKKWQDWQSKGLTGSGTSFSIIDDFARIVL